MNPSVALGDGYALELDNGVHVACFRVPGIAKPKERPRANFRTRTIHTPKRTKIHERTVRLKSREAIRNFRGWRFSGPKVLWITYVFPTKHGRDIDNAEKAIMDGLQDGLYVNDRQVSHVLHGREWRKNEAWADVRVFSGDSVSVLLRSASMHFSAYVDTFDDAVAF